MSRSCFVIMPFSGTSSCTEAEWTQIFETLFKPAVEGAGLDYECRRSEAMRGNIVAGIVRDLNDSYVVLADLTDRNPNVFYELGVRHALRNRTIIVAQRRADIPFDLQNYASHVYDWKTDEHRKEFAERIQSLLREVDSNPDRPDNPVSDFLQERVTPQSIATSAVDGGAPRTAIQSLVGPGSGGIDVIAMTRRAAVIERNRAAKEIYRLTRSELIKGFRSIVGELNQRDIPQQIRNDQIPSIASDFVSVGEPLIVRVEEFALACVEQSWKEGVVQCMCFAGDLISISESPSGGRRLRFANGVPSLLAWRLLLLMGTKALAEDAFELLRIILKNPIEIERSGRFSHRSFCDQKDLFHPEAFLAYANHAISYIIGLWGTQTHLHHFFDSEESFHFQLAQFLMVVALCDAAIESEDNPLFPAYRLVPQADRAMSALCGRIANMPDYKMNIASIVLNQGGNDLQQKWPALATKLNSQDLGMQFWGLAGTRFPASLDAILKGD